MTEHIRVKGLRSLRTHLVRGQKNIVEALDRARRNTAMKAVKPIRKRVPVAFGELRESVQGYSEGTSGNPVTSVDAPHAAAVEIGSSPHTPNFERLLAWVKLRGMQGISGNRGRTPKALQMRFGTGEGPSTGRQVRRVRALFKQLEVRGRRGIGRHSPVNAAEQVAKAISKGIEKRGTRPYWFVRSSLPEIQSILDAEVRKQLDGASKKTNPTMRVKDSELF